MSMMYVRRYKTVHRDEISIYADIIATESKVPVEKITKALEDWFAGSVEDEVTVGYMVYEELFSLDELQDQLTRLENYKVEIQDNVDLRQIMIEHNMESWHTHHKEGKPCKAKIKQPFWHRIRSFCVRKHYH